MHCPNCNNNETRVLDSRSAGDYGEAIRRRRECEKCGFRFSTYEQIEILNTKVLKKDGSLEKYSRDKLKNGLLLALKKAEILDSQKLNNIIVSIEYEISKKIENGMVSSKEIGDIVLKKLKKLDPISYLRFASVYRTFEDIREFQKELKKVSPKKRKKIKK